MKAPETIYEVGTRVRLRGFGRPYDDLPGRISRVLHGGIVDPHGVAHRIVYRVTVDERGTLRDLIIPETFFIPVTTPRLDMNPGSWLACAWRPNRTRVAAIEAKRARGRHA